MRSTILGETMKRKGSELRNREKGDVRKVYGLPGSPGFSLYSQQVTRVSGLVNACDCAQFL